MVSLQTHPAVVQLAKDLHLSHKGDCLERIREYALERIREVVESTPLPVSDLDGLRAIVADKFRVRVEFIERDDDIARIAQKHADFHSHLWRRLHEEFVNGTTEGITLEREIWTPIRFRFLAVIDARGERASRAFFTAWHEIAHLVIHPEQLPFPEFRRSPTYKEKKDPLESVVDHVASRIGFFPDLFGPVMGDAVARGGGFGFDALEIARTAASPTPSLFATALASLEFSSQPTLFLAVEPALKRADERKLRSPQTVMDFAKLSVSYDLRAVTVAANDIGRVTFAIHPNMRVPLRSVLHQAFTSASDVTLRADEDQDWWETSSTGALPQLPLRVEAARRGRFVYGILRLAENAGAVGD